MISICAVTMKCLEPIEDIFLESIIRKMPHVREILLASPDLPHDYCKQKTTGRIKITKFGNPVATPGSWGHAHGLHACLHRATQEYVMLSDPDIFFYTAVDEVYLNLMYKYGLSVIGLSYESPTIMATTFFPHVYNLMVKKNWLPPDNWLDDMLRKQSLHADNMNVGLVPMNSKWLSPGPVSKLYTLFPNVKGSYDTGCNLWMWTYRNNGRWLSFQTMDIHNYNTAVWRGNFKCKDKLPKNKLLYHWSSGHTKVGDYHLLQNYIKLAEQA
jgi:hypothetical protein